MRIPGITYIVVLHIYIQHTADVIYSWAVKYAEVQHFCWLILKHLKMLFRNTAYRCEYVGEPSNENFLCKLWYNLKSRQNIFIKQFMWFNFLFNLWTCDTSHISLCYVTLYKLITWLLKNVKISTCSIFQTKYFYKVFFLVYFCT